MSCVSEELMFEFLALGVGIAAQLSSPFIASILRMQDGARRAGYPAFIFTHKVHVE